MDIILAVIGSFIISLTIVCLVLKYLLNSNQSNDNIIKFSDARKHLENKIYDYNLVLNSDPIRFANTNHLFLAFSRNKLGLNNHLKDDSFFYDLGINLASLHVEPQTAFCLMPFNSRFDSTYKIIKKACKQSSYKCYRSDDPVKPGSILKQIVEMILESQIIIAVIDGRNPNVFYEIGIAHALGKNVILVSDLNENNIPFDLRSKRFVFYSTPDELFDKLSRTLNGLN